MQWSVLKPKYRRKHSDTLKFFFFNETENRSRKGYLIINASNVNYSETWKSCVFCNKSGFELKCHWNDFFSRFSIVQNVTKKHHCKKDFGQNIIFIMLSALQSVAFPPPSGECSSRSEDRDSKKKLSCVCGMFFVAGIAEKNKLHANDFETPGISFHFLHKNRVIRRNWWLKFVQKRRVDFKAPIACPAWCTLHIENACSIDRLFLKCTLMEQSLR